VPAACISPKTLRSLTISQVDRATCQWIQDMLGPSNEHFPVLSGIGLIFQDDPMPTYPSDFEEAGRKSGVLVVTVHWKDVEDVVS
jgi:hypothetical protein